MNELAEGTHWLPGIIVLSIGVALAAIFLFLQWRRSQVTSEDQTRANLERRAQMLIEQLKELATERHQLGEERYVAEKSRLELEAAAAFRARDEYKEAPRPERRAEPKAGPAHPQLVGALWGGGIVAFFVILGFVLTSEEKPRTDAPMQQGPMQGSQKPAAQNEDKELQEAMARLADRPDDLQLADSVAHEMIRRQRFDDAERITEQSLGFDPFNVEARIHRAVLKTPRGQSQQAIEELQHLAMTYPNAEEARLFLGGIRYDLGDKRGALDAFQRYAAEAPPDEIPPQLLQLLPELRQQVGQ